tara:strand:+ start:3725 stop:5068 length:1344 start_codon:yes stop_codon:yes gene_type:complete
MSNKSLSLDEKIEILISLCEKNSHQEALSKAKIFAEQHPGNASIYNIYGIIYSDLKNYKESIVCFLKSIKLDPNNAKTYNNLASALSNLGQIEEAILHYNKAIKLNPNFAEAHFNLGKTLNDAERFDDAIISYCKAIELKPNFKDAYNNLIKILTFYEIKKNNENICLVTNRLLQNIVFNYDSNNPISEEDIKDFFKTSNNILSKDKNINNLKSIETQIYRRNTTNLNCDRHFEVFNTFDVIPEFCFSCFKVLIEPNNVVDLIKLYFVFDNLNLRNNNTRKCMIELRSNVSGSYKGYIYCSTLNEANEIRENVNEIIKKKIDKSVTVSVKRGCSEYGISYPKYKKINDDSNKLMKYNKEWKEKEKLIDIYRSKKNILKKEKMQKSLNGTNLSDVLIMRNWLGYAKKIGDQSYKNIIKDITVQPAIEKKLSNQLLIRLKQFNSQITKK